MSGAQLTGRLAARSQRVHEKRCINPTGQMLNVDLKTSVIKVLYPRCASSQAHDSQVYQKPNTAHIWLNIAFQNK